MIFALSMILKNIWNEHHNKCYTGLSLINILTAPGSSWQASAPTSAQTAALRLHRSVGYRSTATSTLARDPSSAQCAGKASATVVHSPSMWSYTRKQGLTCAPTVAELLRSKTTCISIKRKCILANTCEHTLELKQRLLNETGSVQANVVQYTVYTASDI